MISDDFREKLKRWREADDKMVSDMHCCGYCGTTAFGGERLSQCAFKAVPPVGGLEDPPYTLQCATMLPYMTTKKGWWKACNGCAAGGPARLERMKHVVQLLPEYYQALLSLPPLQAQSLSLIDVSMQFNERVYGFAHGNMRQHGLLTDPLIACGDFPVTGEHVPAALSMLQEENNRTNPLMRHFKTLAEKGGPNTHGLPVLPGEAVEHITAAAEQRDPTNMGYNAMPSVMSLMAAVSPDQRGVAAAMQTEDGRPPTFVVGSVRIRDTGMDADLVVRAEGLPVQRARDAPPLKAGDVQLTLELAIFAALFPHARGAFAGGQFAEYLRYRMSCGFSPFTLYKPYLMVMYLVRQCGMLQRSCSNGVLERDIKSYMKRHKCSEQAALRKCLKYIVPSNVPGTPAWHYNNLQVRWWMDGGDSCVACSAARLHVRPVVTLRTHSWALDGFGEGWLGMAQVKSTLRTTNSSHVSFLCACGVFTASGSAGHSGEARHASSLLDSHRGRGV